MKITNNFLLLLSFIVLFSACKNKKNNKSTENISSDTSSSIKIEQTEPQNPANEYQIFVDGLDITQMASSKEAAQKFVEFYQNSNPTQADQGLVIFKTLYDTLLFNLNKQHYNNTIDTPYLYEELVGIYQNYDDSLEVPENMKEHLKKLYENGFVIGQEEGITYYLQNRDFLERYFYDKVSEPMKSYLIQKNKEAKEGFASDGGLVITPTRVAERIVWAEEFSRNNPDFILLQESEESRKGYLGTLLTGLDNTPIYDYQTKELSANYEEAYRTLINNYADTETAKLVKPFYEAAKANDKEKANQIVEEYRKRGEIF